jgi:uncharacterized surface protein with fasciclin (FAS1) repeats
MFRSIRTYITLMLLSAVSITACDHDDLELSNEVANYRPASDFIRNNYDLTLFYAALERTGLVEELNGKGPFTVLAPRNAAFNELGIRKPEDFDRMDIDSLRNMMRYHVLNRRLLLSEIPVNGVDVRYATLHEGKELYTTLASYYAGNPGSTLINQLFFNGAYAASKDVTLSNGILCVLDKVMKYNPGTVQDWLGNHAEYSILVAGLKKFGLWQQLEGQGPFTIFAPDNNAFIAAGMDMAAVESLNTDNYIGARLFGVYVLPKKRYFITDFAAFTIIYSVGGFTAGIENDKYTYTLSGEMVTYPVTPASYRMSVSNPDDVFAGPIRVVTGNTSSRNDFLTDNGVVHYMPEVLIRPEEAKK